MRTKGMRSAALLAMLLCAAMLSCAALADQPVAFSEWLESFESQSAPAVAPEEVPLQPESAVQQPLIAPQAQMQAAQPVGLNDISDPARGTDAVAAGEVAPAPDVPAEEEAPAPDVPAEEEAPAPDVPAGEEAPAPDVSAGEEAPAPETGAEEAPAPEAAEVPEDGAFADAPVLDAPQPLRSARIRAVGDLMVHKRQLRLAKQSDGSYDFHPQYALIADALANADYTIANLETTVGKYRKLDYSGFPMFNAPESLLEAIRDAGVDFLTLANNHMLDRYFEGMVNTVNLVEQYGFDFGGANRSPEERDAPNVIDVNGIGIGFLCYTQMTNGMESYCNADAVEYGVNYLRKADFAADVRKLRDAGADVVIALPHWGEEYRRKPEGNTVALAKLLIASGVDVILGSHPHMAQPVKFVEVETADGGTRTGLVAYSLGNFISNMTLRYTDTGLMLEFTIRERQDGSFGIDDVGCVPIYCWRDGNGIRAISSLKYLETPPEGMAADVHALVKQGYHDIVDLLGADFKMLAE